MRGLFHPLFFPLARPVTYVWANATDTVSSHIKIYSVQVRALPGSLTHLLFDFKKANEP